MTTETITAAASAPAADAQAPVETSPLSIREAVELRRKPTPDKAADATVERDETAPEPKKSADKAETTAPRESEPSGEHEDADPAERPPVEPPRSWTKEEKEAFKALSPEHQQRIADRDRAQQTELRRSQNEAAEARKAAQATQQTADAERQKYENQLPVQFAAIQRQAETDFGDIRSVDDISRMAEEDPLRFSKWQALKMKYDMTANELSAAQERNERAQVEGFQKFAQAQDEAFLAKFPELKNKEVATKTQQQAVDYLVDNGFAEPEINALYHGKSSISLRDARLQALIMDALKYRTAKANLASAPKAAPASPVQKPGVASNKGDASDDRIKELSNRLDKTGNLKDGLALFKALRRA